MTLGSERDLLPVITRLARQAKNIDEAVDLIQAVLAGQIGGAVLLLEPLDPQRPPLPARAAAEFLESRSFPFRGLYTAPLVVGKGQIGKLIACFGSFGAPAKSLPNLTSHVAEQLSTVLARTSRDRFTSAVALPYPVSVAAHPEAA